MSFENLSPLQTLDETAGVLIERVTEDALLVRFKPEISIATNQRIQALVAFLRGEYVERIIDVIPSYTTLLVQYDLLKLHHEELEKGIMSELNQPGHVEQTATESKLIQIPVCYDRSLALDGKEMEQRCNLPLEEIAHLHGEAQYTVFAIGFCPGLAFLGNVDKAIARPRKATPRLNVTAGSVAIANLQTTVYPMDTPGGWNIIGSSPMNLIDFSSPSLCPFEVGDRVQFSPIGLEEYRYLKEVMQ